MDFSAWDEAIATRLQPIRTELSGIPVAALPREAGKFGTDEPESIDWLFPSYNASISDRADGIQEVTVNLAVRLYFQRRYPTGTEKNALEWAERQILRLLPDFWLPSSYSPLRLINGRLFAPTKGQWYKEITFFFKARLQPSDAVEAIASPVQTIGIDASHDFLAGVSDAL